MISLSSCVVARLPPGASGGGGRGTPAWWFNGHCPSHESRSRIMKDSGVDSSPVLAVQVEFQYPPESGLGGGRARHGRPVGPVTWRSVQESAQHGAELAFSGNQRDVKWGSTAGAFSTFWRPDLVVDMKLTPNGFFGQGVTYVMRALGHDEKALGSLGLRSASRLRAWSRRQRASLRPSIAISLASRRCELA